jgi:hypothetical protein
MSYTLQLRRMTPHEAADAVFGPEVERVFAGMQITPRQAVLAGVLHGITAQQAGEQAFPHSQVSGTPGFTQAVYDSIVNAAASGNFTTFNPSGCSGIAPSGGKIFQTASGLALTGLNTGLALSAVPIPIAGPIIAGASLLVGLFNNFFTHHAAAVKREQQVICAAVPAASDTLRAIDQAVNGGTITPAQAITALQSLQESFGQAVAPIIKNDASHCNAACVWVKQLEAIVLKKSSDYQDRQASQQAAALPAGSSAPASGTVAQITQGLSSSGPAGIPVWAWIAAAAAAVAVLRG